MSVSDVYPHYVNKVEKKGQTRDDLHELQMIWHTKTLNLLTRMTTPKVYIQGIIFIAKNQ